MKDLTGKEHVNRVPVLISGIGVEQLLGVPKLASGTGVAKTAAVITFSCLRDSKRGGNSLTLLTFSQLPLTLLLRPLWP